MTNVDFKREYKTGQMKLHKEIIYNMKQNF